MYEIRDSIRTRVRMMNDSRTLDYFQNQMYVCSQEVHQILQSILHKKIPVHSFISKFPMAILHNLDPNVEMPNFISTSTLVLTQAIFINLTSKLFLKINYRMQKIHKNSAEKTVYTPMGAMIQNLTNSQYKFFNECSLATS